MEGYKNKAADTLQKVTAGVTKTTNSYYSLFHSLKDLYMIRQNEHESVDDYFYRFESAIQLVTHQKDLFFGQKDKIQQTAKRSYNRNFS